MSADDFAPSTRDWHIGTDGMELRIRRDEEDTVGVSLGHENIDDAHATTILSSRLLEMIDSVSPGAARAHLAEQEPALRLPDESEMEVVGEWLVIRNAQEPDYPADPEYGPYPYSDAAPLVHLARVAGFPPEPPEPTDAEVEAAAGALWKVQALGTYQPHYRFENLAPEGRDRLREQARAALAAARGVKP